MAVTNMANEHGIHGTRFDFLGLSTDDKPTGDIDVNSLFLELDTGDVYYYDGSDWQKVGG